MCDVLLKKGVKDYCLKIEVICNNIYYWGNVQNKIYNKFFIKMQIYYEFYDFYLVKNCYFLFCLKDKEKVFFIC